MEGKETILFGMPVPSDGTIFLIIVAIHIIIGMICTLGGLAAMLSKKTGKIHPMAGKTYYWGMTALFITIVITSIMRWPFNTHLLIIGTLAYALTVMGKQFAKNRQPKWIRLHTVCMGFSYVLLMTGFYVDNGKNLPFWNQFSQVFLWVFPSVIGIPIIAYAFYRHPLNKIKTLVQD